MSPYLLLTYWNMEKRWRFPLRQVMSLSSHLWNASRACKCRSYVFEWGNIKFSKTVILYLKSPMKSDNNCHKCCFFCSNSVIKSLFFRLDQPVRMRSPKRTSQSTDYFYSNRDFNSSCSDALTLPISDWLFHSEGGASCDWAAIWSVAFFLIPN